MNYNKYTEMHTAVLDVVNSFLIMDTVGFLTVDELKKLIDRELTPFCNNNEIVLATEHALQLVNVMHGISVDGDKWVGVMLKEKVMTNV